ncbi:Kiwa anti-phage protein KwaB-like domain-containing protein [Bosea sp. (in: a-proteobacteria)]|uniref:Kiwa anti-phage protein KwaB-like domain-containing protein n=1 Tax=Bosea sp. (in: a-proteobacteria) TaxID=1871050 RepID=UPI002B488459|nr:Kiwa anti-phage protein KwaB-like domain-containing protein [Bosea sp. (in: a-proteobacteria)]WRH59404.1 MAG: DUF4868 domain-containing protein [Bosea sp. (in: a-proteobacteria)]
MNDQTSAAPNFADVAAVIAADPIANVYMAFSNPRSGFQFRLYRIAMKDDLAERFLTSTRKFVDGLAGELALNDLSLHPYDASTEASYDELEWIKNEEVELLTLSNGQINSGAAIETLDTKGELPGRPIFSIVSLTAIDGKQIVNLFQPFTLAHELSHRGIVASFFDGAFNAIDQKVFLFEDKWAVISFRDDAFVVARAGFERMFDLGKSVLKRKETITKAILDVIPLADAGPFIAYCSKRQRVLQKLEMISRRQYFQSIDIERIKSAISAGNLPIKVNEKDGQFEIVCTKENAKDIVDLLNDDILRSLGISDQKYRVRSKRQF